MNRLSTTLAALALTFVAFPAVAAGDDVGARVQAELQRWLKERAAVEQVTGIAAYVSLAPGGPGIEAYAGRVSDSPDAPLVDGRTLFQIGSVTKSFTSAIILQLEAEGRLSIEDTVGRWLPEYPAWKDVTIHRLLDMTSGLPNYSETEGISKLLIADPFADISAGQLLSLVYPTGSNDLPGNSGYYYSNTNYVLAELIAERAGGQSFRDMVHHRLIEPLGLDQTYYEDSLLPVHARVRLPQAIFGLAGCSDYQPDCTVPWNKPLVGKDVSQWSLSWARGAGAAVSTARDVDRWVRALFGGKVVPPKQLASMKKLVSMKGGHPMDAVSEDDPRGFALGIASAVAPEHGTIWFYEGETLGFRTLYMYFLEHDIVITLQTNSQPAEGQDTLGKEVLAILDIVTKP